MMWPLLDLIYGKARAKIDARNEKNKKPYVYRALQK